MAVCGYNARMGEGIRLLFEGMYEAILDKSREEGIAFEAVLKRELIEIPQINAALGRANDHIAGMFGGLNVMALAHFTQALDRPGSASGDKAAFMAEVDRFIGTLAEVEDHNVSIPPAVPRTEDNIAERAARVGEWILNTYYAEPVV